MAALFLAWGEVYAAGLGRLSVQSALGQPLQAEIELLSVSKEELNSITARLASHEAFRQARIERLEALNALRFSVVQRPSGQPIIWITSSTPINDPFVDLLIELNWASGRLTREYTILLDPPKEAKPAPVAQPAPIAPPAAAPAVEAKPAAAEPVEKPVAAAEPKAEKAAVKEYGPVKSGETLRGIADKVKPAEATSEQMMVALYKANRSAFLGDNMNRLRKGRVLKVPDVDTVMLTSSPHQARKMLASHTRAWRAAQAPAPVEAPKDKAAAAGKIEPAKPAEKPAPAAQAKDVIKLSKTAPAGKTAADAKTQERLNAAEEELAAKNRALKEAQDRVAQLERTVQDMQKLLALKSEPGKAPAEPKAAEPKAPEPAAAAAPEPADPKAAAPAPAPKPAVKPEPTPAPEPSLVDTLLENPAYLGGGLAGILLLALIGLRAKQRRKPSPPAKAAMAAMAAEAAAPSIPPETLPAGMFAPTTEGKAPASQATESSILTDFSRLGLGSIDTQEIDPIAEAEVYLAYGRDAQAEEILREALGKAPGRQDILQKLLEIYHGRKDTRAYESTARELQTALGGEATPVWNRVADMGRAIDPSNPLYGAGTAAAAAAPAAPAAPAARAGAGDLDFEFSMNPPKEAAPAAAPAQEFEAATKAEPAAPQAPAEEMLSFESITAPAAPSQPEAPTKATQAGELNLDEAFNLDFATEAEPAPAQPAPAKPAAEVSLADLDFSGIDLELEPTPAEPAKAAPPPEPVLEAGQGAAAGGEIDPELRAEVSAKLDLARAYLEMGDKEGAREILQEALAEGDSQQKAEANKLMAETA